MLNKILERGKLLSLQWKMTMAFCVVIGVVLLINFLLFYATLHITEDEVSSRRLAYISDFAIKEYQQGFQGPLVLDHLTVAYERYEDTPAEFQKRFSAQWQGVEDFNYQEPGSRTGDSATVMSTTMMVNGQLAPLYIVEDSARVTITELEERSLIAGVILYSLLILAGVWLLIYRISGHLAAPLHGLARVIKESRADDLAPIEPAVITTEEQAELVDALNDYRQRIYASIQRERAFSRYVSHELRTPLMVISGVATLLGVSRESSVIEKPFIDKQRQRLETSCQNMQDITETLLSLVRQTPFPEDVTTVLDQAFIEQLVDEHRLLIRDKAIQVHINATVAITLNVPATVVRILLGNLIKNAFGYTRFGEILFRLDNHCFSALDTGPGIESVPEEHEGHGLGLMMVNDICARQGWSFSISSRDDQQGCLAMINFSPDS
ncbi:sensor histidine kinase [Endozoicomonas atrinae]|uniref:sensor histidine kinase n=1 Tax=Endozoicomonas atrinae TaxID=1333660 RepID=UPI0008249569|nr:HAMP domain-containing sensor histidine kinase [Endozoicomonas atrinae]